MDKTPLHVDFADWLAARMTALGFNHSDLARRVWGTVKDTRGYDVARNRDRISNYLAGVSYPSFDTRYKLAKALSVFPDDIPRPGEAAHAADAFAGINRKLDRIIDLLAARQIE
jgi:transcriptional regulator with XRE-family HTH domain